MNRDKALLLEWMIRFGTDWVYISVLWQSTSELIYEVERLQKIGLLELVHANDKRLFDYRLTNKALNLLGIEEDDRE